MKSLLYIIAGLLVVIWVIVFKPTGLVHLLLILAVVIPMLIMNLSKG